MAPSDEPSAFGKLLRQRRLAAGLTQAQLADRAGLSVRGISDLERGARTAPHPHTVRQLALALQLTEAETPELIAAARRDNASVPAERVGPVVRESHPLGWPVPAGAVMVVVALATSRVLWLPSTATPVPHLPEAPTSVGVAPQVGQQLLVADSLADPTVGVFTRAHSGSASAAFSNGGSATYQWDFAYMYSAIVAHVLGPYPSNPDNAWLTAGTALDEPVPHDFAVQVRGRITRSPESSAFGLAFQTGPNQVYGFEVSPADQGYRLWLANRPSPAAEGRSTWILPASQPNLVSCAGMAQGIRNTDGTGFGVPGPSLPGTVGDHTVVIPVSVSPYSGPGQYARDSGVQLGAGLVVDGTNYLATDASADYHVTVNPDGSGSFTFANLHSASIETGVVNAASISGSDVWTCNPQP